MDFKELLEKYRSLLAENKIFNAENEILKARLSMTDQWRICFKWLDGHAEDVAIEDYH